MRLLALAFKSEAMGPLAQSISVRFTAGFQRYKMPTGAGRCAANCPARELVSGGCISMLAVAAFHHVQPSRPLRAIAESEFRSALPALMMLLQTDCSRSGPPAMRGRRGMPGLSFRSGTRGARLETGLDAVQAHTLAMAGR